MILIDIIKLRLRFRREQAALEGWVSMQAREAALAHALNIARNERRRHDVGQGTEKLSAWAAAASIENKLKALSQEAKEGKERYLARLHETRTRQ